MFADSPFELRAPLVNSEGHRCDRTAMVVNWDGKSKAYAKHSRFLEELSL
jgi:hypothetical protein